MNPAYPLAGQKCHTYKQAGTQTLCGKASKELNGADRKRGETREVFL